MHALLASFLPPAGGTDPAAHAWVDAADWAVLFTLGTLLFLLGALVMWAWLLWRRNTQPEPHVQLLMELEAELQAEAENAARTAMPSEDPDPRPSWEQSPDWWKQADS